MFVDSTTGESESHSQLGIGLLDTDFKVTNLKLAVGGHVGPPRLWDMGLA
jgi:hypothetical protein